MLSKNDIPEVGLKTVKLFTGSDSIWRVHLRAAINMFQRGRTDQIFHLSLKEEARTILGDNLPLPEYEPVVAEEVINFRFVCCTIIWLDIVQSVTSGSSPHLHHDHSTFLGPNSQTRLEDVMGCKNAVMLQVGRIASLSHRKLKSSHESVEYEDLVRDIRREIDSVLTHGTLESLKLSNSSYPLFSKTADPSLLVTRLFAHMAAIYLHLVLHGFHMLEAVRPPLSEALRLLSTQVTRDVLPGLVAPLFITGLVATDEEEQNAFRTMLSSAVIQEPLLKHRQRVLACLEEVWSMRRDTPRLSWQDVLALTSDILLI
jgi:C6 transcription factor Pro1